MITWKLTDFLEPSWTNPDDFLTKFKDNFEDLRSFSTSLSQFTESLKGQLTTIIHDDYTEFVSISKQLLQLGDTMSLLLKSLHSAEKAVAKASLTLESSSQPIKAHSDKLHNVRHEYAVCALALEAIEHLQSIENQLDQVNDNLYKLLDISIGFAVTKAKLIGLDQPAERKPIETEYDRLHGSFINILNLKFNEFLEKRQKEFLLLVFNTAVMSGAHKYLQESFGEKIKNNLLVSKLDGFRGKRGENASAILAVLIDYLSDKNSDLLYIISISPDSFDFMLHSFWMTVAPWIDANISFPIGDPVEQIRCYKNLTKFFDICEDLCKSNESVLEIRNSQFTSRIQGKLRLDIYAQLISNKFLASAEKSFSEPLKNEGGDYFLSLTGNFYQLYSQLFSDDIFIIEQSKDFAIIAMKLIVSLNHFATNSPQQYQPYFVSDLKKLGCNLKTATPDFLLQAMQIAVDSLLNTSDQIRIELIKTISEKCVNRLKYIGNMTAVGTKNVRTLKPSEEAVASINGYFEWAKSSNEACADDQFLAEVVQNILAEFLDQASKQLSQLQKTYETIQKFRKAKSPAEQAKPNMFSIEGVQKQLKTDLDFIANLVRGKNIAVDSLPVYNQIVDILVKDFSAESA